MKALENVSASDEAGDFVTKKTEPNMQDFQQQVEIGQMKTSESPGELEELNKNVSKYFFECSAPSQNVISRFFFIS